MGEEREHKVAVEYRTCGYILMDDRRVAYWDRARIIRRMDYLAHAGLGPTEETLQQEIQQDSDIPRESRRHDRDRAAWYLAVSSLDHGVGHNFARPTMKRDRMQMKVVRFACSSPQARAP